MSKRVSPREVVRCSSDQDGFSTIEFVLAMSAIVIGLLSYIGSVIASSKMSMETRARIAANVEMAASIEEFRELAADDFVGVTDDFQELDVQEGLTSVDGIEVSRKVILDETQTSPPMDLNGDGETDVYESFNNGRGWYDWAKIA